MKYTNRRAFEKHLEGASSLHFADIYLIISKDSGERKEAVDLLIQFLSAGKNHSDLCLKSYEAERLSSGELASELQGLSFFSDKRIVLINQGEKLTKPLMGIFETYFAHPNAAISLVISASSIHSNTNFYKKAEKFGIILDIPEEKPWEKEKKLKEWLAERALKAGKKMDDQSLHFFLKQVGVEQLAVQSEFEKLLCYAGERVEITSKDVTAICSKVNMENGWQLGESIFRRDPRTALRIARALLEEGIPFLTLLRQVRSQFQTEFQVCSIVAAGGTVQDVSVQFPYMRGIILERHVQNAQSYGMRRFKEGLIKIDEAELKFKSSMQSTDVLMEVLIVKLAAL